MQKYSDAPDAVDLTECDREPIQFLNKIQNFGCLIALTTDWIVAHASMNCEALLGVDAADMIGEPLQNFIPRESLQDLSIRFQHLVGHDGVERFLGADLLRTGQRFDISMHRSDRLLVLEFEPSPVDQSVTAKMELVQAVLKRMTRHKELDGFLEDTVVSLRALAGFDRVMVYRFEQDGAGTVVAEARADDMEPYLGLRYPASDIPKQARALYERAPLRLIADVDGETHDIVPQISPTGDVLDLSLAGTRAVSPIHLEYLRNMGVQASMSVSILIRGKLWGLLACHSRTPTVLTAGHRASIELFGQLFNYELAARETDIEMQDIRRAQDLHDMIMARMTTDTTLHDVFNTLSDEIWRVIPADGFAVFSNGEYSAFGAAPTKEEFLGLAKFLNGATAQAIFAIDDISARYKDGARFADRCSGLLAIPISRTPRDYIVLFRSEIARSVTWAGRPDKAVTQGHNATRLSPRTSFAAWQEVVRGKSAPWRAQEIRAAEALRVTLLEVVLKMTDQADVARREAQRRQELLIGELNHRVRHILGLIRGLVPEGQSSATRIGDYARALDDRILALARAQDQLTRAAWRSVPLRGLLDIEPETFALGGDKRVSLAGEDVALTPGAFTTLALVVHELMTNATKYGALRDPAGRVELSSSLDADGSLKLLWTEKNGPHVAPPDRTGFGTTIIERAVPHDLNGTAEVFYNPSGLQAVFHIPKEHIKSADVAEPLPFPEPEGTLKPTALQGDVLIVEDNLLIAFEAQNMFTEVGASRVHTASTVDQAHRILDSCEIALASLDVNLKKETSLSIAKRCLDLNIPVILTTGYGRGDAIVSEFPKAPVCVKPYTRDQLWAAIRTLQDNKA